MTGTDSNDPIESAQADLFVDTRDDTVSPEYYVYDPTQKTIARVVRHRNGRVTRAVLPVAKRLGSDADVAAAFDLAWLKALKLSTAAGSHPRVRIADLFCGCGGMTLGIAEACRALGTVPEPVFANDIDERALTVYENNFPTAHTSKAAIETVIDGDFGSDPSPGEAELLAAVGNIDVLLGGPPCQGHSNLNNHTRRSDDRNRLFLKMARFAELFRPNHIVIENVIGVRHDTHGVFNTTWRNLEHLGYSVDGGIVWAEELGVAQRRPRVLMIASATGKVSMQSLRRQFSRPRRDFMWACGDLLDGGQTPLDAVPNATAITQARIDYLFDNNLYELPDSQRPDCHRTRAHTYQAVYGRIRADQPSPTITTGFMTMGRGRFVHPLQRRTLTAHEAARIQFFPDCFDFGVQNRESYLRLIGNAVPPKMAYVAGVYLMR